VRVTCPSECVFLDSNQDYQQKRAGERLGPARRDFYKGLFELGGENAAALFNLIEVVAFGYFHDRRDGVDGEVIAAIQALRRSLSPLHVPAAPLPVFAEHLKKEYDAFAKQQPEQVADPGTAPEVLDRALAFVSDFSGTGLQSQRFLAGLIGYIRANHPELAEHLAKRQEGGRIVLPGRFAPSPVTTDLRSGLPHTHGPGCEHHHH
jgi:hypothetical protein